MQENEIITPAVEEAEDTMLPEGWTEDDDIFAAEDWSGDAQADAPAEDPVQDTVETVGEPVGSPTTETREAPGDHSGAESAPTTEPPKAAPNKLKFTARVDRADVDVEVEESELPTLYQKAQVTDRVQAKLAKQTPLVEKAERLSRALGFENWEAMLNNAEQNFRDTELQRLTQDGAPKELAEDYISRRLAGVSSGKADAAEPAKAPALTPDQPADRSPTRDFEAEARELIRARPELAGKKLPQEVVQLCVTENKPLLAAYSEYEARREKAEADKLRRENAILKQNAASAARAPVSGVHGGGATDTKPEDDFIKGFNSDD